MPNLWGILRPRGSVDAAQRAAILVGYPLAFGAPVITSPFVARAIYPPSDHRQSAYMERPAGATYPADDLRSVRYKGYQR